MKIRPSIWLMTAVAVGVITLAVWHRHTSSQLVQGKSQPQTLASATPSAAANQSLPVKTHSFSSPSAINPASPVELTAGIKTIISGQDYRQREVAVHALGGKLTDDNREALYDFLRQPDANDGQQLEQVLKNDLMNALCQMQPPPQGLRELLSQIYQDNGQNLVLRDYAVQHLAAFYQQMALATGVDNQADELKQTQATLWDALANTDSSLAGTALLGLSQLSQQGWPGFDQNRISATALKLAGDNNSGDLTRITALQVCATLGNQDALPVVLAAAQANQDVPVQISAIAALGTLGGPGQVPFLNQLLQGNNDRLKLSAQHALARVEQRLQTAGLKTAAN